VSVFVLHLAWIAALDRFDFAFPENGLTAFKAGSPIGVTVSVGQCNAMRCARELCVLHA
jgi:hypothetical protein